MTSDATAMDTAADTPAPSGPVAPFVQLLAKMLENRAQIEWRRGDEICELAEGLAAWEGRTLETYGRSGGVAKRSMRSPLRPCIGTRQPTLSPAHTDPWPRA